MSFGAVVSPSSPPSSFTVVLPCTISILITCLFESSSHVILESIINHIHKKSVMTGNRHNINAAYKCRITSPEGLTITLSSRAIVLAMAYNFHNCWTSCCCCLPTPMTISSGRSQIFPIVFHQPASTSIWPAVQYIRQSLSTNPGVTMWCVCGCSWKDDVCRVCECYRWGTVVIDMFRRGLCVSMIWGRVFYLFWVGQGWGGEVYFQSILQSRYHDMPYR